MQVGLGNFDVVAEDLIEANLERADARALALALFHCGDDLFAVFAEVTQLVKFSVKAAANNPRFCRECRGLVGDSALKTFANIGEFVDFVMKAAEKFAASGGRRHYEILQYGKLAKRLTQGDEFARSCEA